MAFPGTHEDTGGERGSPLWVQPDYPVYAYARAVPARAVIPGAESAATACQGGGYGQQAEQDRAGDDRLHGDAPETVPKFDSIGYLLLRGKPWASLGQMLLLSAILLYRHLSADVTGASYYVEHRGIWLCVGSLAWVGWMRAHYVAYRVEMRAKAIARSAAEG